MACSLRPGTAQGVLVQRLRARRAEIEQVVLTRVCALADSSEVRDPEYELGLRSAVQAGIAYGFSALENDGERPEPIPAALPSQARRAARSKIGLDTVLRRYAAAHTLFDDFIIQEALSAALPNSDLRRALHQQANLVDHLLDVISSDYRDEISSHRPDYAGRRLRCARNALAGKIFDPSCLDYELDTRHLGLLAVGPDAESGIRALAERLRRPRLVLRADEQTTWAWFAAAGHRDSKHLVALAEEHLPKPSYLAIGEPADGLCGWRLTHRQAVAALPIALRGDARIVCYADVSLLASALQDETLTTSLHNLYLKPLAEERDRGETLIKTLRAYSAAEGNISSTAAALGVSRQTISNRLGVIESRVGRPLRFPEADWDIALRLQDLRSVSVDDAGSEKNLGPLSIDM